MHSSLHISFQQMKAYAIDEISLMQTQRFYQSFSKLSVISPWFSRKKLILFKHAENLETSSKGNTLSKD